MNRHHYLQKREEREALKNSAGPVSARFPAVSAITLRLTYLQRGAGPTLMKRTMNFYESTPALFRMDCLQDGCGGGFDLTDVVKSLVRGRKSSGSGRLACGARGRPPVGGHMSIAYEVAITYRTPG